MKTLPRLLLTTGLLILAHSSLHAGDVKKLVAVLTPTTGNKTHGVVLFKEQPDGKIKVEAYIEGLVPNSKHGFHIHEFGDLTSRDGKAAGGHFNPEKHEHGMPGMSMHHAGDLGNIEADSKGVAKYEIVVDDIKLTDSPNAIIGRGLIVHEKMDDGSQPVGNAGARIAQGVIGVKGTEVIAK